MRHHTTTWILSVVILHSFISYAMLGAKPSKTIGRLNFCRALNQSDKTFNWWVHWLYQFLHNLSNLAHLYPRNNFSHTWGTEKKLLLSYLERLNELPNWHVRYYRGGAARCWRSPVILELRRGYIFRFPIKDVFRHPILSNE